MLKSQRAGLKPWFHEHLRSPGLHSALGSRSGKRKGIRAPALKALSVAGNAPAGAAGEEVSGRGVYRGLGETGPSSRVRLWSRKVPCRR